MQHLVALSYLNVQTLSSFQPAPRPLNYSDSGSMESELFSFPTWTRALQPSGHPQTAMFQRTVEPIYIVYTAKFLLKYRDKM